MVFWVSLAIYSFPWAKAGLLNLPAVSVKISRAYCSPGLEETEAGIKIAGRKINNLRYADDTTLMAESEEELKSLLMKVKEESEKLA